jgi:hypothetical protein
MGLFVEVAGALVQVGQEDPQGLVVEWARRPGAQAFYVPIIEIDLTRDPIAVVSLRARSEPTVAPERVTRRSRAP